MDTTAKCGILFDLDGTLIDTAPDLVGSINDLRQGLGKAALPIATLAPYCSYGGRGLLAQGLGLSPRDTHYPETYERFITQYQKRMTRDSQPYAGIHGLLTQLEAQGHLWGVVTNKVEHLARPLIEHMAFQPNPACIIGGDTAARSKPAPEPLWLACRQLGLSPERCLYIGDSDRDIQAGHAAGMATIAAAYGYIPPEMDCQQWGADLVVDSSEQLWPAIQSLLGNAKTPVDQRSSATSS